MDSVHEEIFTSDENSPVEIRFYFQNHFRHRSLSEFVFGGKKRLIGNLNSEEEKRSEFCLHFVCVNLLSHNSTYEYWI